jgi:methylated-DNA-[protein]-cysteine S-methyltransferase
MRRIAKYEFTGPVYYRLINTSFGDIAVLWIKRDSAPLVIEILLPRNDRTMTDVITERYGDAVLQSCKKIDEVCSEIEKYFEGFAVKFSHNILDMDRCRDFQKRVLQELAKIPRGKVIPYGELAEKISVPCAARAVGTALARNPFPIVFPCHRVVRASGHVGEFGGGQEMKRKLLQLEGIEVKEGARIDRHCFSSGDFG